MNRTLIGITALVALLACSADAQVLRNRKPGLWELQYTAEESERQAEQAQMAQRLKSMTPEQRAQMEAAMKQHGMGMTLSPDGKPTMMMRFCLTPQDIAEESRGVLKGSVKGGDCDPKVLSQSSGEVRIHAVCRGPDGPGEVDARIYDVTPEHYAVDMKAKGVRGDMHMQQKAHWVGSDCTGAAF
jgi:hypothetical protein